MAVLVMVVALASSGEASPITIHQFFGPAQSDLVVNGVTQSVAGNWDFYVNTDTSSPDLAGTSDLGRWAANVTVSNAALGLVNVRVLSHSFYYEIDGMRSGITDAGFSSGTVLVGAAGVVGDPNVIEPGLLTFNASIAPFLPRDISFVFPSAEPLTLGNGMTISTTVSVRLMAFGSQAVPETATLLLFATGGGGVLVQVRRRKQRS